LRQRPTTWSRCAILKPETHREKCVWTPRKRPSDAFRTQLSALIGLFRNQICRDLLSLRENHRLFSRLVRWSVRISLACFHSHGQPAAGSRQSCSRNVVRMRSPRISCHRSLSEHSGLPYRRCCRIPIANLIRCREGVMQHVRGLDRNSIFEPEPEQNLIVPRNA
jgi:hypothetical protein